MGRIIVSAGHDLRNTGAVALGTTESREMMLTRDLVVKELQTTGVEFVSVPDNLDLQETISWINANSVRGDVAVELHGNIFNGSVRGTEAFHIANNSQRQKDAQLLLDSLLAAVPGLTSRGVKPDTSSQFPQGLAFCRRVAIASILLELCFIDNREDLRLLQNERENFAKGITVGLIKWSGQTPKDPEPEFPIINIRIKNNDYTERGILVNNNSYIPVDLVELLGIDYTAFPDIRLISYGSVVYVKAVDLQQFGVAVSWENSTRTVILNLNHQTELSASEEIMGLGNTTLTQLTSFLSSHNEKALSNFPDLPQLYIEQAAIEGVNHDVAFSQMCLETNYLNFGGSLKPEQNNFGSLGATGGGSTAACFPDVKTGVKAHIQHLKAYASKDIVRQPPIVDPRFGCVPRAVAPLIYDLGKRWHPESDYGMKIRAIMMRLYGVV
ncbi:hormogonium tapered terminus morphoprotein TftA [Lyngbya aestuarii]|uniref:hormogonium tapered terminus morphoprotein TftA n=1 Tax=Lyngbya aestuarii TaxID=118322 RepID=UPI00403DA3A8